MLDKLKRILGIKVGSVATPDTPEHPYRHVDSWLDSIFTLAARANPAQPYLEAMTSVPGKALLAATDAERFHAFTAALRRFEQLKQAVLAHRQDGGSGRSDAPDLTNNEFLAIDQILTALSRQGMQVNASELEELLTWRAQTPLGPLVMEPRLEPLVRLTESCVKSGVPLTTATQRALSKIQELCDAPTSFARNLKLSARIRLLLAEPDATRAFDLVCEWARALEKEILALPPEERDPWVRLLRHAAASRGSRPSRKFLDTAAKLLEPIGSPTVNIVLARWFEILRAQEPSSLPFRSGLNAGTVAGLVWMSALPQLRQLTSSVVDLALYAFKKVPNVGAISTRVGNACIAALAAAEPVEAMRNLATLKARIRYPSARRLIEDAIAQVASRSGTDVRTLEDISVPTHGLSALGKHEVAVGPGYAQIALTPDGTVSLTWSEAKGSAARATVPAALKREDPGSVKRLQREAKGIEQTLKTQAARFEAALIDGRAWDFGTFRERVLGHAVLGNLARRLIWASGDGHNLTNFMPCAAGLINSAGNSIREPAPDSRVSLWHPIDSAPAEVLAWRRLLEGRNLVQPFKQAHREVYLLTEAELTTETYSNRFAAHILKQHQLASLCQARGWRYRLQGDFDSWNAPTRELPNQAGTVEFLVDANAAGAARSPAGIFLYVVGDQVRFTRGGEPIALADVPARIFSEAMRDVDLFVGVASVANDPTWRDSGPPAHREYWDALAFGDLNAAAAETRREQLARIIPALKIRDQLSVESKYLVVRGKRGTYKIHLGSANVLMEPNRYLCIVQGGRGPGRIYLPFEGDTVLPLILSKAVLLAADDQITDASILSQMNR